jgi:hypothetical protein
MSQHDGTVANADGATVRADINSAIQALLTNSSGSSAPGTTFAYQWWIDTTNNVLKQRNSANSAWITRGSSAAMGVLAKTTTYTVTLTDFGKVIDASASGGAWTLTLPAAATAGDGFVIAVKKTDSSANAVTIDGDGSETIDGATTLTLPVQYMGVVLRCDGSNWHVVANAGAITYGEHSIWVPGAAWKPATTNGAGSLAARETTATRPDIKHLPFDGTSREYAQTSIRLPKSWDRSTLTAQPVWSSTATDTDAVRWVIQAVACGDGDTLDVAYGTGQASTDANQSAAEDCLVAPETSAITVGGSPASEDLVEFQIYRDCTNAADTMSEDALLIGVTLYPTINARNDA